MTVDRFVLYALFAGSCVTTPRGPATDPPTAVELASSTLDATVSVESGPITSAGWFIAPGVVVTVGHALLPPFTPTVEMRDGKECAVDAVTPVEDDDVAFLWVSGCDDAPVLPGAHPPEHGLPIMAAGHPDLTMWAVSEGVVAAPAVDFVHPKYGKISLMQVTTPLNGGNSGGPIVDERGAVVGMSVGVRGPTGWWSGVGVAVPIDRIHEYLARIVVERAATSGTG